MKKKLILLPLLFCSLGHARAMDKIRSAGTAFKSFIAKHPLSFGLASFASGTYIGKKLASELTFTYKKERSGDLTIVGRPGSFRNLLPINPKTEYRAYFGINNKYEVVEKNSLPPEILRFIRKPF